VTELSNALATLGRGTTLPELLKLIHFPGYNTSGVRDHDVPWALKSKRWPGCWMHALRKRRW